MNQPVKLSVLLSALSQGYLEKQGYDHVRELPNGEWIGLMDMLFTVGLFYGLDMVGYECRWCYGTRAEAEAAINEWDGQGDPPGEWKVNK